MAAAAFLTALAPAGARAESAPQITSGPAIAGTAQVGATLTAAATWTGEPSPTASWAWLRCARATGSCTAITGATSASYPIVAADAGSVLRVRLRVTNSAGSDEARSAPTAVIGPAPTPTPTPTATATPAPTPSPPPATTPAPAPSPSPPALAVAAVPQAILSPSLLEPFPVVRIKGLLTPTGARVTLFTVRAPRGAQVTVACRGRDCPRRRWEPAPGSARLRPFERSLRAGTRLTVAVTRPGFIGKLTVIVIRRGAPPRRTDRCLVPGAAHPTRCSAL